MTDQGPPTPRRAHRAYGPDAEPRPLPELDAETRPLRAIVLPETGEPASPVSPSETVILRRLASSPASPAGADDSAAEAIAQDRPVAEPPAVVPSTPVPPPVPVLPDPPSSFAPASGRRFSASSEPLEQGWAAPRRSAISVTSPPMPDEDAAAPAVTSIASRPAAGEAAAPPTRRSRRPAAIVIAAVVVVGLIVGGVVWATGLGSSQTAAPSPEPTVVVPEQLLTATDLGVIADSAWVEDTASTSPTDESPQPLCLPLTVDGLPGMQSSAMRRLTTSSDQAISLVHYLNTFEDEAQANAAYTLRATQAGTCPDAQALVGGGFTVAGLADSASGATLTVQGTPAEYHTLLVSRSGRTINLIDVAASGEPVAPAAVAEAAALALERQCFDGQATCPTTPKVTRGVPAAGTPIGWLVEADLPRITDGAGRWGATDPSTTLTIVGSQCEAVDLVNVTGTQDKGQRTFLLADDPAAHTGFGVDQVTYSFSKRSAATDLADKLTTNLSRCARRTPTAKVTRGPAVKGTGVDDVRIAGATFEVRQRVERTLFYRVAVVTVGNRVVYLLANPDNDFDFTDAEWAAIGVRAGQRVSQIP